MICKNCGGERVRREWSSGTRWICPPCKRVVKKRFNASSKGKAYNRQHNIRIAGTAEQKARSTLNDALRTGKIARRPCIVTGARKAEAHHAWGYAPENWRRVIWLCRAEHVQADRDPKYNKELIRLHDFVESI